MASDPAQHDPAAQSAAQSVAPSADTATHPTWRDEIHDDVLIAGIVRRFISAAMADPVLRPWYESTNLDLFMWRLTAFLVQYWGGPREYYAERGLPRLPLRHQRLRIGPAERDAWLAAMHRAIAASPLSAEGKDAFYAYVEHTAESLVTSTQ